MEKNPDKTKNCRMGKGLSPDQTEALEAISQRVETKWTKINKRSVNDAIEVGRDLIEAKKIIFKEGKIKKGNWGKYREEFFPFSRPRQRSATCNWPTMLISKKILSWHISGKPSSLGLSSWGMVKLPQK